tara:strand:- start:1139 stop:1351 length:213 start_codon:yes stop_codon:yes gene_type:complete
MKKYNSILPFSFSIDHDELDGSDLTAEDLLSALNKSYANAQEVYERATQCGDVMPFEDTVENHLMEEESV